MTFLRKTFHNAQKGVQSVHYIVVQRKIFDLLRKDVIAETVSAQIAELFNTDEGAEGL